MESVHPQESTLSIFLIFPLKQDILKSFFQYCENLEDILKFHASKSMYLLEKYHFFHTYQFCEELLLHTPPI